MGLKVLSLYSQRPSLGEVLVDFKRNSCEMLGVTDYELLHLLDKKCNTSMEHLFDNAINDLLDLDEFEFPENYGTVGADGWVHKFDLINETWGFDTKSAYIPLDLNELRGFGGMTGSVSNLKALEMKVLKCMLRDFQGYRPEHRLSIEFNWFTTDENLCFDDTSFVKAIVEDMLIKLGVLSSFGIRSVANCTDSFTLDDTVIGVEVRLKEVKEQSLEEELLDSIKGDCEKEDTDKLIEKLNKVYVN